MLNKLVVAILIFYKTHISVGLATVFGHSCRFEPTCSAYSIIAIKRFGLVRGGLLSLKRIVRCNPFSDFGFDPVPQKL